MFLVALTKKPISHQLQPFDIKEVGINSRRVLTVVTDRFLSKFSSESNKFRIIESPLVLSPEAETVVFSEVIFDKKDDILDISKSTFSGRPIYYLSTGGEFYCSTHIFMLRDAGVLIEENCEVLPEFFVYRYVMPPNTLYKNIKQLHPGSHIRLQFINGKYNIIEKQDYCPPNPIDDQNYNNDKDISRQTLTILTDSLQAVSSAKTRIVSLLSGGLDSSILCQICKKNLKNDVTFSTAYPFEDLRTSREKEYALSAASALGTEHTFFEVTTKDYLCGFLESIKAAEEPLNHLQSVMFYLLFRYGLPNGRDIVISGEGADGTFGLPFHDSLFRSEKRFYHLLSKFPFIIDCLDIVSHRIGKGQGLVNSLKTPDNKYLSLENPDHIIWSKSHYGDDDWVRRYYNVKKEDIIKGRYASIKPFENRSLYDMVSIMGFLSDTSVSSSIWSKLAESQGKAVYYPFNNVDMMNYIYTIPWARKLAKPKIILRGVARQLEIPEFIITRPKSGFGVEAKNWANRGGTFEPLVPLAAKVFDEEQLRNMQCLDHKKSMTFWNILNYSIWKRLFIKNEPLDVLLDELNEASG